MDGKLTSCLLGLAAIALSLFIACNSSTTSPPTTTGDKVHGEYLFKYVSACGNCHTQRDGAGQPIESLALAGGQRFVIPGVGVVYSKNITTDAETGIGSWTDLQIIAAIRDGVGPSDGPDDLDTVLTPAMPSYLFAHMTDSDVRDMVAYMRTLKAIHYEAPEDTIPGSARIRWSAQTGIPDANPNNAQTQRGKYLVTISGCIDCHTVPNATPTSPLAQGANMSLFLAGGREYPAPLDPTQFVSAKNITPDSETGIGGWTPAMIDSAMALGWDDEHRALCAPMPWMSYGGMTKDDRNAIIAYIQAIPAINHEVDENTADECPHP